MLGGVVTVGIASLTDRGGGSVEETVVPTACPALDKSDGPRYQFANRPTYCLTSGTSYTAVFDTSEGEVRFALDTALMPETTNNFVVLARYGYYDDTIRSASTRASASSREERRRPTTGPTPGPATPFPTKAATSSRLRTVASWARSPTSPDSW